MMPCQTGIRTTVQCCTVVTWRGWAGVGVHVEVCWATITCRDLVRSTLPPGRCGGYMEVGSGVLNGMTDVKSLYCQSRAACVSTCHNLPITHCRRRRCGS